MNINKNSWHYRMIVRQLHESMHESTTMNGYLNRLGDALGNKHSESFRRMDLLISMMMFIGMVIVIGVILVAATILIFGLTSPISPPTFTKLTLVVGGIIVGPLVLAMVSTIFVGMIRDVMYEIAKTDWAKSKQITYVTTS